MDLSTADALAAGLALLLGLNLLLCGAALGMALPALVGELAAQATGKVFHRKLAQQLSRGGLICWLYLLVVVGGVAGYLISQLPPETTQTMLTAVPPFFGIPWAAWLVLTPIYALTWKVLRNARPVHILLGLLTAASGLACAVTGVLVLRDVLLPWALSPEPTAALAWPPADLAFPALATFAVVLCVAAATVVGYVYMLLRRVRDDWGRDYYVFAARALSAYALVACLAAAGTWAWLVMRAPELRAVMDALLAAPDAARWPAWLLVVPAAGLLLAGVCHIPALRSAMPLRLKVLAWLALLFGLLALAAAAFLGLVPSV